MAALLASPHSGLESPFARLLHQRARQGRQPPGNRRRHHPHSMAMAEVCAGKDAEHKNGEEDGHKNGEEAGPLQPLDDAPKSLRVASWRTQEVERSKQRAEIEDAHKAQRDEIEASLAEKRRKHEARAKRKRRKEAARKKAEAERKKAEAERKAQEEKEEKQKAAAKKRQLDRQKLLERQLIEKGGDTMRLSVGRGLRTRSAQDRLIRETADTVVKNLEGDHALLARVGANLLFRELHAIDEPEYLMCPITLSLFSDPVCAPSGHTYEREAIESHLSRSQRDPMTREPLTKDQLWPNLSLKKAVDAHRRLFPDAGQG